MLTAGSVLNSRYEVGSVIADPSGTVYVALDRNLADRRVAIKAFADGPADARAESGVSSREDAMRLASLEHGHLVPVIDFFENGNEACLVLAVTDGRTLASIAAERDVSAGEALGWIEQITRVLAYLHGQSPPVLFGDLKPSNVVIDDVGRVRLVPFGVAQTLEAEQSARPFLRDAEAAAYGAAEQLGNRQVDERADIYSVGALMYRLLTGERPPPALSVLSGQSPSPRPRDVNAGVMSALDDIVVKAMAPRRDDRFASVRELRAALAHIPITGSTAFVDASAPSASPALPAAPAPFLGAAPSPSREPRISSFQSPVVRDPVPSGGAMDARLPSSMPLPIYPPRREDGLKQTGAIVLVAIATFIAGTLWTRLDRPPASAASGSPSAASPAAAGGSGSPAAAGASPGPGASAAPRQGASHANSQHTALYVESQPPGARVAVDGRMAVGENGESVTPMMVGVTPGRHEIWVEMEGFESFHTTVPRLAVGTTRNIAATLQASRPTPAAVPTSPTVATPAAGYPTAGYPTPQPGAASPPGGYGVNTHPASTPGQPYPTGPSVPPGYNPAPIPTISAPWQPSRDASSGPLPPTSAPMATSTPQSGFGDVNPPGDLGKMKIPGL